MSQENEIEAKKLNLTTDFLPSDGASCSDLISLKDFQVEIAKLNDWAQHGCSDGGCQIEKPKGMHTNGGCRCNPRKFSEYLLWLACEVEKHGRYRRWPNDEHIHR